ncbi:MAG: hypothetical protein ACFFD4_25865 [Candidatus Odinarchaeota archaeon]
MAAEKKTLSNQKVILTSLGVIGEGACNYVSMTDAHAKLPELEALGVCIGLKKVIIDDFLVIVQVYFLENNIVQLFKVARSITVEEMMAKGDAVVSALAEDAVEIHRMIRQEPPLTENPD